MRSNKSAPAQGETRTDSTGIPVVKFDAVLAGSCPVCYQPAHVSVHRRGGYFLRCMSCSLNLFTRSPAGSVTFRAQQAVLADADLRTTLCELTAEQLPRYMGQMLTAPTE